MSVEIAENTETVAAETVAAPRVPVTGLGRARSNAVIRVADAANPQDETLDKWYVIRDYFTGNRSGNGTPHVTVYDFTSTWAVGDTAYGDDGLRLTIPAERVMQIHELDYNNFGRLMRIKDSISTAENLDDVDYAHAVMYGDYFPSELSFEGTPLHNMKWPHNSRAALTITGVSDSMEAFTVAVRAFPESGDGDWIERGEHAVPASMLSNVSLLTAAEWKRSYILAKHSAIKIGQIFEHTETSEFFRVDGFNYYSVIVKPINPDTGEDTTSDNWGARPNFSVNELTAGSLVKLGESWEDYQKSQPSDEVKEQLKALSINTVSSALKHADRNDYCSETAVALASAGHSLPELRIKGTVTLEIDFSSKEYMTLRKLFGATDGRPDAVLERMFTDKATSDDQHIYKMLQSRNNGKLPDMGNGSVKSSELTAELVWKAPRIRK